ncbi:NTF2-like protein [Xylariomycetidae sp. FL2044]|nr:NTF2-like protein [Xylariomycetidae sp. FL2044]
MAAPTPEQVGLAFIEKYYTEFDKPKEERAEGLKFLYSPTSTMTFESATTQGDAAIIEKLKELPFGQIRHQVSTYDCQAGINPGTVLVVVTGQLLVDEEQRPMNYMQTFFLAQNPQGPFPYYVHNDIFKLIYG